MPWLRSTFRYDSAPSGRSCSIISCAVINILPAQLPASEVWRLPLHGRHRKSGDFRSTAIFVVEVARLPQSTGASYFGLPAFPLAPSLDGFTLVAALQAGVPSAKALCVNRTKP